MKQNIKSELGLAPGWLFADPQPRRHINIGDSEICNVEQWEKVVEEYITHNSTYRNSKRLQN